MNSILRTIIVAMALGVLSGCGVFDKRGQGPKIGTGSDDYAPSPCACVEIQQRFRRQYVG